MRRKEACKLLRDIRLEHGMSAKALSEALGIHRIEVLLWEHNCGFPFLDELYKIFEIFAIKSTSNIYWELKDVDEHEHSSAKREFHPIIFLSRPIITVFLTVCTYKICASLSGLFLSIPNIPLFTTFQSIFELVLIIVTPIACWEISDAITEKLKKLFSN